MRKTYFDFRFIPGIIFFVVFNGISVTIPTIWLYQFFTNTLEASVLDSIGAWLMLPCGPFLWYLLGDKLMPTLTVKQGKVIWRCLLFLPVKMKVEDCLYVGLADFAEHNRGPLSGAGISYIYLSKTPLPKKYQHKIDSIRCKKGFIKFAYSDNLCKHLSEVLPEKQARIMGGYYSMMTRTYSTPKKRKK